MQRQLPTLFLSYSQARESSDLDARLLTLSRISSLKNAEIVLERDGWGSCHHPWQWPVVPGPLPQGPSAPARRPAPLRAHSACALWLQFIQWNIHKSGLKVSEYGLPTDATGPFVLSGYSGYKQVQVPRGRLFAFDSEGNYMLTCSATGGVIYKVPVGVAVARELLGGLGEAENGPLSLSPAPMAWGSQEPFGCSPSQEA